MSEEQIQITLARYITIKDQSVLFHNDFGSGTRLSISQAKRQKAMNPRRGAPDLMIYEPRNGYVGLAIELKRENTRLTKKDGSPASQHVKEQDEYLEELRQRGWKACFAIGLQDCINTVNEYMNWSNEVIF